jgi:hypothetical protein
MGGMQITRSWWDRSLGYKYTQNGKPTGNSVVQLKSKWCIWVDFWRKFRILLLIRIIKRRHCIAGRLDLSGYS